MNLLRKGASPFVSFYLNAPKQGFVGLRTETVKVLKKLATPKKYYEELLKEAPVDSKGILALNASYLHTMINKCETAEDIDVTVSAYYNFLGHYVKFGDNEIDNLLRKSVECKNPQATTDILSNHNYLGYYPHPSVVEGIVRYYRENNLVDDAKKLLKGIEHRKLLKLSPVFFEEILTLAQEAKDVELANLAYKQARNFGVQLSETGFRTLIDSLYQSKANGGARSRLSTEILEAAKKFDISAQDQIKLSFSQLDHPEGAIRSFENLAESNLELSGKEYVLADSELTRSYIEQICTIIADKAKFQHRFSGALKTLRGKYNERAIEKSLDTLIQEHEQKFAQSRAAAKEAREANKKTETETKAAEEPQQTEGESK